MEERLFKIDVMVYSNLYNVDYVKICMGDACSDTNAEFGMLIEAYQRLQKVSPNHELLGVVKLHGDAGGMDFHKAYCERFTKPGDHSIHGYARYRIALEKARGEVLIASGQLDPRAHKPSRLENI